MPWRRMGDWRYSSTVLDLSTRWRWVVSFTPQLLYPLGKSPWYPSDRRVGDPQSRSGCCGEEKIWHCRESNPGHPARCYTDWAVPTPACNKGSTTFLKSEWWGSPFIQENYQEKPCDRKKRKVMKMIKQSSLNHTCQRQKINKEYNLYKRLWKIC
jgi:hypothetical protein